MTARVWQFLILLRTERVWRLSMSKAGCRLARQLIQGRTCHLSAISWWLKWVICMPKSYLFRSMVLTQWPWVTAFLCSLVLFKKTYLSDTLGYVRILVPGVINTNWKETYCSFCIVISSRWRPELMVDNFDWYSLSCFYFSHLSTF